MKVAGGLALATIILTITTTVFSFGDVKDWSFKDAFFSRAFFLSMELFIWTSTNYTTTATDALFAKYYEENVTAASVLLGGASATIDFCSILQGETIRDLIILAVFVLNNAWNVFENMIQSHFLVPAKLIPAEQLTKCLELYSAIRQASDSINNTFGTVFKFIVMQDLFQYSLPWAVALSGDDFDMEVGHTLVDLVKATVVFSISLNIYEKVR